MLLKNDVYIQWSEWKNGAYHGVFIAKHYVKPRIFNMAPLPFKTLIGEKNTRV